MNEWKDPIRAQIDLLQEPLTVSLSLIKDYLAGLLSDFQKYEFFWLIQSKVWELWRFFISPASK